MIGTRYSCAYVKYAAMRYAPLKQFQFSIFQQRLKCIFVAAFVVSNENVPAKQDDIFNKLGTFIYSVIGKPIYKF